MGIWDDLFGTTGDKRAPVSMSDLVTGARPPADFSDVASGSETSAKPKPSVIPDTGMPKDAASLGGARALSRSAAEGVGSVFDVAANFAEAKSSPKDLWDRARGKAYDERGLGIAEALRASANAARDYGKTLASDLDVENHTAAAMIGSAIPESVAIMGSMAAGPIGPIMYEAARTPETPIRGALRGLAYTAAPLKAAGWGAAAIPNAAARVGARGVASGTTAYLLSDDPLTGVAVGLAGAAGAGAPTARQLARIRAEEMATRDAVTAYRVGASPQASSGAAQAAEALRPPAPATGERIASIGLDKFNGYNTRAVIKDAALRLERANPERSIPRSMEQSHAMAEQLAPLIDDTMTLEHVAKLGPQRALSSPQARALGLVVTEAGEKQAALMAAAKANPGDPAVMAEFVSTTAKLDRLVGMYGEAAQEGGRGLQIYRMGLGAPAEQLKAAQAALPKGASIGEVAQMMLDMPDPQKSTLFWRSLQKVGRAATLTHDSLYTLWLNGLLSGPQTHVMNASTNASFATWNGIAEQTGQAILGAARSGARFLVGKGPAAERVYFREIPSRVRAARNAWSEAGEVSRQAYLTGDMPEFLGGRAGSKIENERIPGWIDNPVMSAPSRALTGGDAFFKLLAFRTELGAQATREGIRRGLGGGELKRFEDVFKSNPSEKALNAAREHADRMTFTSELGEFGENIRRVTRSRPGGWVVPFMRTLVNVQKEGIARGPAAVLTPRFWGDVAKGGVARDAAIVRAAPGTIATFAFGSYIGSMIEDGRITGAAADDPAERGKEYEEGKTPYSALVDLPEWLGGRRWINYGRLEPFGSTLGTFVDAVKTYQRARSEDLDEPFMAAFEGAVSALRDNFLSKQGFLGALDFSNMVDDPARFAEAWVNRMAGTVVPSAVRQLARAQDPAVRVISSLLDAIKAGIPGQRETLPQRMGAVAGEPQAFGEPVGGNLVSPIWASKPNDRPIFRVLEDAAAKVSPPPKTLQLTATDRADKIKLRGLLRSGKLDTGQRRTVEKLLSPNGISRKMEPADYEAMVAESAKRAAAEIELRDRYLPKNMETRDPRLTKYMWLKLSPEERDELLTEVDPGAGFWSQIPRDATQSKVAKIYSASLKLARDRRKAQLVDDLKEELGL